MYLGIDTSLENEIAFAAYEQTETKKSYPVTKPGQLLERLDDFLIDIKAEMSSIRGVAVVVGKGRFTATRVAVTVANTLAFSLSVPVVAVEKLDDSIPSLLRKQAVGVYAAALYSAPPSVGKK